MKKGFTLIELIITIGIILILSNIILSSYNYYTSKSDLEAELNKIIDIIDLTKKKSIASEIPSGVSCENFTGYSIIFTSNNKYSLNICCNSNCTNNINLHNFSLKRNIIFYSYPPSITFSSVTGEIKSNTDINLIIKNNIINECQQITINKLGIVNFTKISCP